MSIKWQPGMKVTASVSIEPIELDKDFGTCVILGEDMPDLQKKVLGLFEEVSKEANLKLRDC